MISLIWANKTQIVRYSSASLNKTRGKYENMDVFFGFG